MTGKTGKQDKGTVEKPFRNQVFPSGKRNNFAKETAGMKHSNSSEKREPGKQTTVCGR